MLRIHDVVNVVSGTPQFRIAETLDPAAPVYKFYSQADLELDLKGLSTDAPAGKQVRTFDNVRLLAAGEIVFSLISGMAAVVQPARNGRLLTQNYAVLYPSQAIDGRYLVYLLNESQLVRRQLYIGQQGSITIKFSMRQLGDLNLPALPPLEMQKCIGDLYFSQLKLEALKKRVSELETAFVLESMRKAEQSWTS